eukprot:TRINITY_DN51775_c0_g1_i1.p1 TRINITY_DN51775_c0_g1~~TRINITY_DN51775_c0_g1_i1.p1  ORF type:complete len:408 (-),score=71.41 TRINITY_DN51775_c0_g1_i1:31-1254(-)
MALKAWSLLCLWMPCLAQSGLLPSSMRMPSKPATNSTCPCADVSLCKTPMVQHERELFGFDGSNWRTFNWTHVTTVAWSDDSEIVCQAHAAGARRIAAAPRIVFSADRQVRKAWIDNLIDIMKTHFFDGVTFDYESPLDQTPGSSTFDNLSYYVALINETTTALHDAIPGSQTSVCVAWSPDDIDGRNYDYKALAAASDLTYVMVYDTQSQIFGRCIASANSPLGLAQRGIERYLQLGIPAEKLIMGTPWYGYMYPCLDAGPEDETCNLKLVPFRGVNCSDAAGSEVAFMHIMNLLDRGICPPSIKGTTCQVTRALSWDSSTSSPYFNFVAGSQVYQVWFDNAASSALKYSAASHLGIRGVGPFTWSDLDSDGTITGNPRAPAEARSMWEALGTFKALQKRATMIVV